MLNNPLPRRVLKTEFEIEEVVLRDLNTSFYEELQVMDFRNRCIVLGIVLGTKKKEIALTLNLSMKQLNDIISKHKLGSWNLFRALLDN